MKSLILATIITLGLATTAQAQYPITIYRGYRPSQGAYGYGNGYYQVYPQRFGQNYGSQQPTYGLRQGGYGNGYYQPNYSVQQYNTYQFNRFGW